MKYLLVLLLSGCSQLDKHDENMFNIDLTVEPVASGGCYVQFVGAEAITVKDKTLTVESRK